MKEIRISLTEDEYLKVLKGKDQRTHKQVFLDGAGVDYEPTSRGRTTAFDVEAAEERMFKEYLKKIKEKTVKDREKDIEARKALGLDLKTGETAPKSREYLNKLKSGE